MKLLIYELSKLSKSRILLVLLAVLLAVNVWLLPKEAENGEIS